MYLLKKTIKSLSKEEIINYKLFANRTRKEKERKDILLFDLMKKSNNDDANDTIIFNKLYNKPTNKNTYHRLKSRLLEEIDTSTVQFHFHKTDTHYILNEITLYKTYLQKTEWELALYHLKKAESKAISIHDFALLDVIYTEFINLSVQYGNHHPNTYILKRKENSSKLNDLRALDDAIANIIYDLKRSQNFSKTNSLKSAILNKAIQKINSKKQIKQDVVFKSKLYTAISNLLLSQKDYVTLESYAIKTFNDFTKNNLFEKHNHQTKIQMLMYICNTLFINKKHSLALEYIQVFKHAIHEFKNLLYDNYVFFYYNFLANNYSVINPNEAIVVLNEAKTISAIKNHSTHLGYVYLNLAGAYFDTKHYKLALKNILNLYKHSSFNNLDQSFRLNININEVILRIENEQLDVAKTLIKTVLKQYHSYLSNSVENKKDYDFLILLQKLIQKRTPKKTVLGTLIKEFINKDYKHHSNSIINYNSWLKRKYEIN